MPVPARKPVPEPTPDPHPTPESKPVPQPTPESKPVPQPTPESKPVPQPTPESKPVPQSTPETQPFWDGCAAGELRLQLCTDCGQAYFYPRPVCPACGSVNVEWFTASGRATLYSYVINHRPAPGFEAEAPYAIAVVQLAEGPRMMTNLVGVPNTPEDLVLDMPLRVTFEPRGDVYLPMFTQAREGPAP